MRLLDFSTDHYLCKARCFEVPGGFMWSCAFSPQSDPSLLSLHVGKYTFDSASEALEDLQAEVEMIAQRLWLEHNPQEVQEQMEWVRGARE